MQSDYILRNEGRKSKIYHNCSGKHCGQLSICIHQKFKTLNYQDPKHPVQKLFIQNLEKLSETKINHIGIDGCGLPAPSLPLERFAYEHSNRMEIPARIVEYPNILLGDENGKIISTLDKELANKELLDRYFVSPSGEHEFSIED